VRIAQVLVFAVLASLAGKRIRWLYFVVMVVSITVFNTLNPLGEVLFRLGSFPVTRGALRQGLMKGFAIPGLVFISLFAVQRELRLPGRLGGMVARLFHYFELLLEGRSRIRLRTLVSSVDTLLLGLMNDDSATPAPSGESEPSARTTPFGYLFIFVLVAAGIAMVVMYGPF
jgi:heptaprenyl diphosphate synthase